MINKVTLIGNLGKDPEVRRLENGAIVARLALATNESYKDKDGNWQTLTEWHTVICWRGLADRAEQSLKKGSLVYVEGKLTTRKWQDKDGNDRYTTEVVARTFRSMDRKDSPNDRFPSADDEPGDIPNYAKDEKQGTPATQQEAPVTQEEGDLPF